MKKIRVILSLMISFCFFIIPVVAEDKDYVVDDGNLLSSVEEAMLEKTLEEISTRQQLDVVVVTVDSLEGKSAMAYADDYFDYQGYGQGSSYDGILFLLSMEYGDYWTTTTGRAIDIFNDNALIAIENSMIEYLRDGEMYVGFVDFAESCDTYIEYYNNEGTVYEAPVEIDFFYVGLAGLIGLFIAALVVAGMAGQLKSVKSQPTAHDYVKDNSYILDKKQDIFLYKTMSVRARPKKTSSSGGSRTHRSSSGRSHGGRGGRL